MTRILGYWLLVLWAGGSAAAQTPAAARLRRAVAAHPGADTARVNRLNALALELRNNAPDESAGLFRAADSLSRALGYAAGAAEAALGLGFYYRHRSEYGRAVAHTERARQGFARVGDGRGQTRSLFNLSAIYSEQGRYVQSLAANLQGLALAEARHDPKWEAFLNSQLGGTSIYLGEYARARQYLNLALRRARASGDPISVGYAYSSLGDLYRAQGQWAAAQRSYERDAALHEQLHDEGGILYEEVNVGDMEERQQHYGPAFAHGFRALALARRLQTLARVPRAQLLLARAYLHTGRPDSALAYGQPSLRASRRNGTKEISRDASQVLAQASVRLGRFADAYRYEQVFSAYKDSLNSNDLQRRAAVLEYRAELAQKQDQIGLLTRNSALIRAQNRQQRRFLLGALLGLAAVAGLSGVLWRSNRLKQRAYALLKRQQDELRATQSQLVQAEKWALVGELSAGIAHELQNPLNFMKNFAEVSVALLDQDPVRPPNRRGPAALEQEIMTGLKQNLQQISQHGQRASSIISDLLAHARAGAAPRTPTDLNALVADGLDLAYRGLRAREKEFTARLTTAFDAALPPVPVVPPDLSRVLINLFTNAFHAVRQRQGPDDAYQPAVSVTTRAVPGGVEIRIGDNGTGMSAAVREQAFQPFFTTKPAGEGTGLGLSLARDIVTSGHGGTLTVESREGEGSEFVITLPA